MRFPLTIALLGAITVHAHNPAKTPTAMSDGVRFIENKGQWPGQVLYKAELRTGAIFLEGDRFTFNLFHPEDFDARYGGHDHAGHIQHAEPKQELRWHAYSMIFEGAQPAVVTGAEQRQGLYNYFHGSDESKWGSGAKAFGTITYGNIYPGIDLVIYSKEGHLKYDWILKPDADPTDIAVRYEGADGLTIQDEQLLVSTSVNQVIEHAPITFAGNAKSIPTSYVVDGNIVRFDFGRPLPKGEIVRIDPTLAFATYTGSTADNFGFTATYDQNDFLIGGGIVFQTGYPLTLQAYQSSWAGGVDIGITKFNADGSALLFSTYIGGSGDETPNSCVVSSQNEVIVFGVTGSSNFPTTAGCYDNSFNGGTSATFLSNGTNFPSGTDLYVSKLNSNGTTMLGSTFIGGTANDGLNSNGTLHYNYGDQFRGEVVVDGSDNILITSSTHSANFPVTAGSFQTFPGGGQDAVVVKFNQDLTSTVWSSFLGGGSSDAGYSLKVTNSGSVLVTGGTSSVDMPVTLGALNVAYQGGTADGYVGKVAPNGASMQALTYLGTSSYDQCYFVEFDQASNIWVVGQTSGNYPTTAGVYMNANSGQFVTKLDNSLTTILASTRFGKGDGDPELSPTAFLVDACHNVYVSGWGGTTNLNALIPDGNISGMPLVPGAYQSTTDGSDFYFIVFEPDLVGLQYSTYFGGSASADHVDGGTCRFNKEGIIYSAVCASCGAATNDFPTTPGAWSSTDQSATPQANCNLGVFKFDFQLPVASAVAVANPDTRGCEPFDVTFSSVGSSGLQWFWDFGDGNTATVPHPTHTFVDSGIYTVTFIAMDTTVCFSFDTTYLTIEVVEPPNLTAAFDDPPDDCAPLDVQFVNNSSDPGYQFMWDFGDGNTSNAFAPAHTYNVAGQYTVELIMVDTGVCMAHDTTSLMVEAFPFAVADFDWSPVSPYQEDIITFNNLSTNSSSWLWDFGDGNTSNLRDPAHSYPQPGMYDICLTAYNVNGCDDSTCKTLRVFEPRDLSIPTAFTPNDDGLNDIYYHYATGHISANLKIFNRWGLLVFETDDLSVGWDGKWKDKEQEIAVFAYILTITFPDNPEVEVYTGNVTLIR